MSRQQRQSRSNIPRIEFMEERKLPSGMAVGTRLVDHLVTATLTHAQNTGHSSKTVAPAAVHPLAQKGSQTYRNLTYASDTGAVQKLDVYLPAGQAPVGGWPVVMAIHGGGWRRFSKEQYGPKAAVLTQFGYAVVAPSYTLSNPGVSSWSKNLQDVRGAVRWVRIHADRFSFNTNQIAAMGESAGGHLALLLGLSKDPVQNPTASAAIQAVASFAGPTDLRDLATVSPFAGMAAKQMMGSAPDQNPAAYSDASPVDQAGPNAPPILLVHGQLDTLVPASQTTEMAVALNTKHDRFQLLFLPRVGHGIPLTVGSVQLNGLLAFLKGSLK